MRGHSKAGNTVLLRHGGASVGAPGTAPTYRTRPSAVTSPDAAASNWSHAVSRRPAHQPQSPSATHRRRRGARLAVGIVIGAIGVGFLASEGIDWLRSGDRLPPFGLAPTEFRSTTLLLSSQAPAPAIQGTLQIDTVSGSFEFTGRPGPTAPQAGWSARSVDGRSFEISDGAGGWQAADASDPRLSSLLGVLPYVVGIDGVDDVLAEPTRDGNVTLVDAAQEGVGEEALDRFEMSIDTRQLARTSPDGWSTFQAAVIPAAHESSGVPLTIWLDGSNVVVRLRDAQSNWAWQRLDYTADAFVPG